MPSLGTTLRCNLLPRHIWIVITTPARANGEILLVNLTSLTEECADDACILTPSDYGMLTHNTTVACSRSQIGTDAKLDALIQQGYFFVITSVPEPALQKILQAARESRELSADKKRLIG